MSSESPAKKVKKPARTPEERAAKDARKAAKAAAQVQSTNATSGVVEGEAQAESSAQALKGSDNTSEQEMTAPSKKRRREGDDEPEDQENLLEIDVEAPEPLSKAEARAAKKRAKKGLPDAPPKKAKTEKKLKRDDDGESAGSDGEAEKPKKDKAETKRQNSIWIGNLSFRTTQDTLRQYLENGIEEAGGKKEGCITRINMPKKPGEGGFAPNKGFAYVDFATSELQAIAVGLSETFFEGRKLLIKLGNDHAAQPDARTPKPVKAKLDPLIAGILKRQQHPESSTLFVGNLGFDATEDGLRDFIEANAVEKPAATKEGEEDGSEDGEKEEEVVNPNLHRGGKKSGLRKVRLGAFEDTGRCKGFAFFDFYTGEDATRTLTNRANHFYGGRKLNLQYASAEATKRSGGGVRHDKEDKNEKSEQPKRKNAIRPPARPAREEHGEADATADVAGASDEVVEERGDYDAGRKEKDQRGKKWQTTGRPRPGAALAMAKREKVGIVKGEGAKIVFD